ncbi:hypothetical protein CR513_60259, partial [Mucuna pruriens]
MATLLEKYRVVHRVTTAYHPQTNAQTDVFNREIKKLLQKMANPSQNDWSHLLEDALWAHRTTYRSPLGMSPYPIVFDKACHLPMEIEHGAYWVIKKCNMLQELKELHLEAYENSWIYKEKVKHFHDNRILRKEFSVGQKVLLFNSRLKLIASKLRSGWDEPFVVTNVFPYGTVEVRDTANNNMFKVNGYQLKPYHEGGRGGSPHVDRTECRLVLGHDGCQSGLDKDGSDSVSTRHKHEHDRIGLDSVSNRRDIVGLDSILDKRDRVGLESVSN